MGPSPLTILQAVLLVAGLWWCKEVLQRLPQDIADMKDPSQRRDRFAIVFVWICTLGILIATGRFVYGLAMNISRSL